MIKQTDLGYSIPIAVGWVWVAAEDSWGVDGAAVGVEVDQGTVCLPVWVRGGVGSEPVIAQRRGGGHHRGGVGQVERELVEPVRPVAGGGDPDDLELRAGAGEPEDRAVFAVTPGEDGTMTGRPTRSR